MIVHTFDKWIIILADGTYLDSKFYSDIELVFKFKERVITTLIRYSGFLPQVTS